MEQQEVTRSSLTNSKAKRNTRYKSHTTRSVYKWLVKQGRIDPKEISEKMFKLASDCYGLYLIDQLCLTASIKLPYLGSIDLYRNERKHTIREDGTVDMGKTPVDWKATLDLWLADPEARAQKLLIWQTDSFYYVTIWNKRSVSLGNKIFYRFFASRHTKCRIRDYAKEYNIDAFTNG